MTIETHILDRDCTCARCGVDLKPAMDSKPIEHIIKIGDRVGVISGLRFSEPSAYLITKPQYDSNALCVPRRDSIP